MWALTRTQITSFLNSSSDPLENTLGVPQGSVLGPILFIMYINDIKKILHFCEVNLFADDTVLFIAKPNLKQAETLLNLELNVLDGWLKYKKLALNINKTKYMIISNKNNQEQLCISINQEQIANTSELKYLGIIIDNKLTFGPHIDNVIAKVAKKKWGH